MKQIKKNKKQTNISLPKKELMGCCMQILLHTSKSEKNNFYFTNKGSLSKTKISIFE